MIEQARQPSPRLLHAPVRRLAVGELRARWLLAGRRLAHLRAGSAPQPLGARWRMRASSSSSSERLRAGLCSPGGRRTYRRPVGLQDGGEEHDVAGEAREEVVGGLEGPVAALAVALQQQVRLLAGVELLVVGQVHGHRHLALALQLGHQQRHGGRRLAAHVHEHLGEREGELVELHHLHLALREHHVREAQQREGLLGGRALQLLQRGGELLGLARHLLLRRRHLLHVLRQRHAQLLALPLAPGVLHVARARRLRLPVPLRQRVLHPRRRRRHALLHAQQLRRLRRRPARAR
eukprot:scaffold5014_cov387-Prasinococcus_capsulatus_cf.AAC.1